MSSIVFIRDLAVVLMVAGGVGWVCQRLGLSLVVGYLIAGAVVGPFTPPFQLVADLDRVQMLSQVGLVFLIFSIGLNLSFQRLRRLGIPVVVATVIGAILVFHGCRLFGLALGWNQTQSLFLAGMLMVSSSAIISKVLQELNATHQRPGQLALGVTVMEDVVAVVMLTLLSTLVRFGGEQAPPLASTLWALGAFVLLLALAALLLVPRLLLRLTEAGSAEVRTIIVIGLLLLLAWLAARAGYSLALGAFLLGVIVASTPQKPEIERAFEGLRDMFGAVFFVSMGMLVDFSVLGEAWLLILGVTVFTVVWRSFAASAGLVLAGNSTRESFRAGFALTPLGEFSFIIAQMGVLAGAVPAYFYPMAIGVSLLSTLSAPLLMRRSSGISTWLEDHLPLFIREWVSVYHGWLRQAGRRQKRSTLWKLTGKRLAQVVAQILFVSALVLFARPAAARLGLWFGEDGAVSMGLLMLFWIVFGLVALAPLVAVWRNLEALSMIFAESAVMGASERKGLQPVIEMVFKAASSAVLLIWLAALLPFGVSVLWAFLVVTGVLGILAALFWRRLVFWHSKVEIELRSQLRTALGSRGAEDLKQLLEAHQDSWQLQAEEFAVPDFASAAGNAVGELALRKRFGCSIASVDRQGIIITNPGASLVLYPRDRLLLVGTAEQIDNATRELSRARTEAAHQEIQELSLETVSVPAGSAKAGKTLAELDPIRKTGVQVAGIQRPGKRILTPSGDDRIEAGDELLVLGRPAQIVEFTAWLNVS